MDPSGYEVRIRPGLVPEALEPLSRRLEGNFFQSPQWVQAVTRVRPDLRAWIPVVHDARQQGVAALPLFEVRRFGTRRLYGGPWGTYGGVLSSDAGATGALLQWLHRNTRSAALVRVHDFSGGLEGLADSWRHHDESCQVLSLPDDPQALFEGAFTSQNRNKIRKAEKNGVSVTLHSDAEALLTYAELYGRLAQRLQVASPLPAALFPALAGCSGVQVWLARHEGDTVAGLLNLRWGGQIMNWGNVSSPESWKVAPNNLLHWKALEHACRDAAGPRLYNFGSSAVSDKVHAFKKAFGAVDRVYRRTERMAPWLAVVSRLRGRRA